MLITFSRSILIYIFVLIVMRLMGKREIGQLQPFELAISIMIADLASTPMSEIGIPILYGIIPIFGLLFMHVIISILNIKSVRIREIICGKPRILINKGRIDEKALIQENFTINELQERLRVNNVNNISEVEYAILETSGQISVVLKANKRPVTPEDMNLFVEDTKMSYDLIVDGRIMEENLYKLHKDKNWLKNELKKFKLIPEATLIFVLNEDGTYYCQKKLGKKDK